VLRKFKIFIEHGTLASQKRKLASQKLNFFLKNIFRPLSIDGSQ